MQGFEQMDGQLTDTGVAGHLVPAGSMFAFLAAHRAGCSPTPVRGPVRPAGLAASPATRMAAIMTLQALHDYSDRETAEAVRFDVRWKVAIGAAVGEPGFDPSSLVYWRKRIARSGRPHRVNDAIKTVVEQTGILQAGAPGGDSTILATRGDAGHRHPAGLGHPPGGPGGARRGGADRGGVYRA